MSSPDVNKDSIRNYLTGIGTSDDPTTAGRPSLRGRLSRQEIDNAFLQNDLARRIVEEIIIDSLRGGLPKLVYQDDGEPVKLGFMEERRIINKVRRAGVEGRLTGGGHILAITDDTDDLSQPLNWENPPKLQSSLVLSKYEATATRIGNNATGQDFRNTKYYAVHPHGTFVEGRHPNVHRSRLISFRGNELPKRLQDRNNYYDDSVLQNVWTAISNFLQSEQALVNIINRFETATIAIAGLKDIQSEDDGEELVRRRMEMLHQSLSILNAALIDADAGEEYSRSFANVQGLDDLWDRLASSVARAARMPMTQLFGEDSAGIRGDNEAGAKGWRKQVNEYRVDNLLVPIVKIVTLHFGRRVRPVTDEEGRYVWDYEEVPKPVDRARIQRMKAQKINDLLDRNVIDREEARILMGGGTIDWEGDPPPELEEINELNESQLGPEEES